MVLLLHPSITLTSQSGDPGEGHCHSLNRGGPALLVQSTDMVIIATSLLSGWTSGRVH